MLHIELFATIISVDICPRLDRLVASAPGGGQTRRGHEIDITRSRCRSTILSAESWSPARRSYWPWLAMRQKAYSEPSNCQCGPEIVMMLLQIGEPFDTVMERRAAIEERDNKADAEEG